MSQSRRAVFLDRDNTLIASDGYLGDASKVVLISGAADAIADLRRMGFAIVVVSNQSGVARGMFTEEDTRAVNARMQELLLAANPGAHIDRHEYCPHHPEAKLAQYRSDCDCRKPKAGMITRAAKELGVDLSRSWLIGDAPRDVEAGALAGCRTILFTDPALDASPAAAAKSRVSPEFEVTDLASAVDIIRHESK